MKTTQLDTLMLCDPEKDCLASTFCYIGQKQTAGRAEVIKVGTRFSLEENWGNNTYLFGFAIQILVSHV